MRIETRLQEIDGGVRLCVEDNGIGFDVDATLALSNKWGLRRLRDTVRDMGGELCIQSSPERGTRVLAAIGLSGRDGGHLASDPDNG